MDEEKKKASKGKVKNTLLRGMLIGILCGILTILISYSSFIKRVELFSLDLRFRLRPQIKILPEVGYVDMDEASEELCGSWPWPRNRHVALVRTLGFYNTRAAGYDVFFSERSDVFFLKDRFRETIKNVLDSGPSEDTHAQEVIYRASKSAFRDYDSEFEGALKEAKNIYLASFMESPSPSVADGGLKAIREFINESRKEWTPTKIESMEAIQKYSFTPTPEAEKSLFKVANVIPPLARFTNASAGAGFAQIVKDFDAVVRLYPNLLHFDTRIFPSIGIVMASNILGFSIEDIVVKPGEYIEIPPSNPFGDYPGEHFRIPVNEQGQMLLNWAGTYEDTFFHISFRDLSYYYAYITAKEIARSFTPDLKNLSLIRSQIFNTIMDERMVTKEDGAKISLNIALSHCITPLINKNITGEEIYGSLGNNVSRDDFDRVYEALRFAAKVRTALLDGRELNEEDIFASSGVKLNREHSSEIFENVVRFSEWGRLKEVMPLYFPERREAMSQGKLTKLSPLDLEGKILMIGLIGEGTIDLNPMPYQRVCPMVAMHSNFLNTVLSRQFLRFPKAWWGHATTMLVSLLIGIICSFLAPAFGLLTSVAAVSAYSGAAFALWIKGGQWIKWVSPVIAVFVTYMAVVVVHFIQALREKRKVRGIFSAMVSPNVLKMLEENPEKLTLKGERKPATMFFSGIDGFDNVTKGVAPEDLGMILSVYLTPTSEIIMDYGGYIDKYEGHIIMADFGVPLDDHDHAWKCSFSAIEQQQDIEVFQYFVLARYGERVSVSMGLNSGYVSAGNMGSDKKMQYTVMGDAVNTAARFRPANMIYNSHMITGESTYPLIKDHVELRMLDRLLLKGKTTPTTIYEVMGWDKDAYKEVRSQESVSQSLQVRWGKCPPEKIIGYSRFWKKKSDETGHPLAGEIYKFFKGKESLSGQMIVLFQKGQISSYIQELHRIRESFGNINKGSVHDPGTSGGDGWKGRIEGWKKELGDIRDSLESPGASSEPGAVELLRDVNILLNKIDALGRRLNFNDSLDPVVTESWEEIRRFVQDPTDGNADYLDLFTKESGVYFKDVQKFIGDHLAKKEYYHEMMADVGTMTSDQRKVVALYEEGLRLHWERRWEETLSKFNEALKISPEDNPTLSLVERVEGYKAVAPAEAWQGEFVQTKK